MIAADLSGDLFGSDDDVAFCESEGVWHRVEMPERRETDLPPMPHPELPFDSRYRLGSGIASGSTAAMERFANREALENVKPGARRRRKGADDGPNS